MAHIDVPDDVINYFGELEEPTEWHELHFEYTQYLGDTRKQNKPGDQERNYLLPPKDSAFREKPDITKYHLQTSGTDFVLRLPLYPEDEAGRGVDGNDSDVLVHLSRLQYSPDRSLLQIATFVDEDGLVCYYFCVYLEDNEVMACCTETILTQEEWDEERARFKSEPWLVVLDDLFNRASDRAYLHVERRLQHNRWYEREVAQERWDWGQRFDAKQILSANLRVVAGSRGSTLLVHPVHEHDFTGQDEGTFLLPCGHEMNLSINELRSASVASCIRFACVTCGKKVMGNEDLWQLCRHRERERRAEFVKREVIWEMLNEAQPIGGEQISVQPSMLVPAIKHAYQSLRVPQSSSPSLHNITASGDLEPTLLAFRQRVSRSTQTVVTSTFAAIVDDLLQDFDKTMGEQFETEVEEGNMTGMPSGWEAMVRLWLSRAVQLAGVPGYDGRNIENMFCDEVMEDEEVLQENTAIDELEEMLRNTSLG